MAARRSGSGCEGLSLCGLVTLRAGGLDDPVRRFEDLRQPLPDQLGEQVHAWFTRQDWLRANADDRLLTARLRAADGLRLRQEAARGPDGWEVQRQLLVATGGLRWVEEVDPVTLTLIGGCDGSAPLGDQLALLAAAHGVQQDLLAEVALPLVTHLVERGMLLPAAG